MVHGPRSLEGVVTSALDALPRTYRGRRVLVTGHTGFKGAWSTVWLASLGARVTGFALSPISPSFFQDGRVAEVCDNLTGDVRDQDAVRAAVDRAEPEVVLHLAAQSIVRVGHADPAGTFATNVAGTVNLLEAVRRRGRPCAIVVVTSDKCYRPSGHKHREDDPLGGEDPYSASKAACEMVVAAYRTSFFPPERLGSHGVAIATARAGNVIGGGDWAPDRIVPDIVRGLMAAAPVPVRNPDHVRPWQHVLEPLSGYLMLAAGLRGEIAGIRPQELCDAWNFAPADGTDRPVRELVGSFLARWGSGSWIGATDGASPVEVPYLGLDARKARQRLGWDARWDFARAIERTVDWYRAYAGGVRGPGLRELTLGQIREYVGVAVT